MCFLLLKKPFTGMFYLKTHLANKNKSYFHVTYSNDHKTVQTEQNAKVQQ